jgi:WASH complex subunit 7
MAYNSMAEDRFDADDKWDLDPFEDDSSRIAGDQKVIEMKEFVEKHAEKLYDIEQTLDETLGAEWDADSDQIGLFMQPYEQVSMLELISTRNTLFNKVMVVFASLCEEINVLKEQASAKFYPGLTLFGQETAAQDAAAGAENAEVVQLYNNGVSEGDIQIQLGKMLPFLQELYQFVQRCYDLLKNTIRQLGALYAKDQKLYQTSFKNVHLRTVFDHLGELLVVLVTLDEILTQNSALPIGWGSYKRMIKTIKKEPAKYGMDEQQLYQFEKLMFQIKGLLLEGLIFQNAIEQEFDEAGVCEVRSNAIFKREFQLNLEGIVELVAEKEISLDDNLRKKYIAACGLFALFHTLFSSEKNNAKLAKTLWELQKEFPIVHLLGPVTWNPANFLTKCVPQLLKQIKAQRLDAQRLQYLATLDKEFAARVRMFYLRINKWLVQMNSDCNPQMRMALLLKVLSLAPRRY